MRRLFKTSFVSAVCLFAVAGCAATPKVQEPKVQDVSSAATACKGNVPSAPSPETVKAIAEHDAAAALSLGALYEAVARGESSAQLELALRYANGTGVEKDGARAFSLLRTAAASNNAVALYFLGAAYANGLGTEKDETVAVVVWEQAANQGYDAAQFWLGFMIGNGRGGIQSDWCAALPLLEAAAKQGLTDAAFTIGVTYHEGKLGNPDYAEAAKWYRAATAKKLNQKAQYNLRVMIERGQIEWQEGDPGVAPAVKKPDAGSDSPPPQQPADKAAGSSG